MKGMKQVTRCALAGAVLCGFLGSATAAPPAAAAPRPAVTIPPTKTIATVNGEAITFAQLGPILMQANMPANLTDNDRRELYREALGTLIDDLLINQCVRKYVPTASAADVQAQMNDLIAGLKTQKKTLADLCRESHQTEADIREDIARYVQWNAYVNKVVSEVEFQKYYTTYKDFFDKVFVRASHIYLRMPNNSPGEKTAGKATLQQIRAQIMAGQIDFAAAAKRYSQCPSAANGGDLAFFPRKYVVDENFARVAFSMRPGEVSDVVESATGLHLIKVTERKPGTPSEYTKVKGEVREFYMEDLKQNMLVQLRRDAKIEVFLP